MALKKHVQRMVWDVYGETDPSITDIKSVAYYLIVYFMCHSQNLPHERLHGLVKNHMYM